MIMKINQKEIDKVSSLEPFERYKYFLKKIADNEVMYTLIDKKGDFIISTIEDKSIFPLWSSADFANLCLIDGWNDCVIKELTLEEYEEEIIDYISDGEYLLNIFPVYNKTGFILDLEEFTRDLNEELENYE